MYNMSPQAPDLDLVCFRTPAVSIASQKMPKPIQTSFVKSPYAVEKNGSGSANSLICGGSD